MSTGTPHDGRKSATLTEGWKLGDDLGVSEGNLRNRKSLEAGMAQRRHPPSLLVCTLGLSLLLHAGALCLPWQASRSLTDLFEPPAPQLALVDLSTQLASERQRSTELDQQLQATRQEKEAALSAVKGTYDRLVAALKGEISQKDIALHQAKERLVVTILDRVLFPSGQATLTP